MNIALFTDTFYPEVNGVATSVNSLYHLLNKMGHNCYVVTTCPNKEVTINDKVIGIPGMEIKKLYGYRLAFIYNSKAFKYIASLNLDIIHINTEFGIGTFGQISANKLGIPLVYTYHTMWEDYTYYMTKGYFDRFSKRAIREYDRTFMNKATEIISPSEKTAFYIHSIAIEKMVNIVPTGFDFTRFQINDEKVKEETREKCGLKKDDIVLLCLGRLAHEKSFDILISGYKKYLDNYKDEKTKMLFVGDGPSHEDLQKQAKKLGLDERVIFIGKVSPDDVPKYYAIADLFLNASVSETQGLTFMESMAAKVPVLCRYDNNLANVINDKITGFFFLDEDNFKDKLDEVLSLSKEEIDKVKENAINSISPFSEESFYNNIMEVYKRAIRRNR